MCLPETLLHPGWGWLFILVSRAVGASKLLLSHVHPHANGPETWQAVRFGGRVPVTSWEQQLKPKRTGVGTQTWVLAAPRNQAQWLPLPSNPTFEVSFISSEPLKFLTCRTEVITSSHRAVGRITFFTPSGLPN